MLLKKEDKEAIAKAAKSKDENDVWDVFGLQEERSCKLLATHHVLVMTNNIEVEGGGF